MMFISASVNMEHRQFTFHLESMLWALWAPEQKYVYK